MTPAGVPVCEGVLRYSGQVMEAERERNIEFEMPFLGIGIVAGAILLTELGRTYRWEGFLARKARSVQKMAFHIQSFEELKD